MNSSGVEEVKIEHGIDEFVIPPALDMSIYEKYKGNNDIQLLINQIDQFRKIIDAKDKKITDLSSKNQVQKKEYESKIEELDRHVEEYRSIALKYKETLEKTQKESERTHQLFHSFLNDMKHEGVNAEKLANISKLFEEQK